MHRRTKTHARSCKTHARSPKSGALVGYQQRLNSIKGVLISLLLIIVFSKHFMIFTYFHSSQNIASSNDQWSAVPLFNFWMWTGLRSSSASMRASSNRCWRTWFNPPLWPMLLPLLCLRMNRRLQKARPQPTSRSSKPSRASMRWTQLTRWRLGACLSWMASRSWKVSQARSTCSATRRESFQKTLWLEAMEQGSA